MSGTSSQRDLPGAAPADQETAPPSLCVQTVLFRPEPVAFRRFVESLCAACALARREGVVGRLRLVVGDSSPKEFALAHSILEEVVENPFDEASYEHFGENLGSAGGHNRLFAGLSEQLVLVVNPDTYASPHLVEELVAATGDPQVGIVEARQLPLEHPKAHDVSTGDTSWAGGWCFLARAQVIRDTGGFDPGLFFMYCDDVDLSWRARLSGWRVVHRPTARIFHDKRLRADGFVEPGEVEVRYSAEAAVLLAWRYGRRDLATERIDAFERSGDELARRVASELRGRIEAGEMPEVLEGAATVADFGERIEEGIYAPRRFSYSEP